MPHLAAELPIKSRATSSIDIEAVMPIGAIFSRQYCTPGNGREEGVSEKNKHQFRKDQKKSSKKSSKKFVKFSRREEGVSEKKATPVPYILGGLLDNTPSVGFKNNYLSRRLDTLHFCLILDLVKPYKIQTTFFYGE